MLVGHTPRTAAVLAHKGIIIIVHAVGARPIFAFPAGWVVIIVAGIVGHTVLAIAIASGTAMNGGGCRSAVTTVATIAGIGIAIAIAVVTSAEADTGTDRVAGAGVIG